MAQRCRPVRQGVYARAAHLCARACMQHMRGAQGDVCCSAQEQHSGCATLHPHTCARAHKHTQKASTTHMHTHTHTQGAEPPSAWRTHERGCRHGHAIRRLQHGCWHGAPACVSFLSPTEGGHTDPACNQGSILLPTENGHRDHASNQGSFHQQRVALGIASLHFRVRTLKSTIRCLRQGRPDRGARLVPLHTYIGFPRP